MEKFYALVNIEGSEERKRRYEERKRKRLEKHNGLSVQEEIELYKRKKGG